MLPWDKIDAAAYTVWDKTANFNKAISNSKERLPTMSNLN
jgi:carboxyl-terminal processing protease